MTRSLTIRTEPPGALVYVNDELKGPSPVSYDFVWYGWHRIMIRKDGFERLDDRKELRAPLYLWIPFDLVAELLPFRIRDQRAWSYALTPSAPMPIPVPPDVTGPESTAIPPTPPAPQDTMNSQPPAQGSDVPSSAMPSDPTTGDHP